MKISVQTGGAEEVFGIEGAFREIAEAGFDGVDANLNNIAPAALIRGAQPLPESLLRDGTDWLELFRPWGDAAKKYGLPVFQAHSLYPACLPRREQIEAHPEYDAQLLRAMERFICGAASIGCRRLVFHPCCYVYADHFPREIEREKNLAVFSQLGRTAKREGVTICLENVFTRTEGGFVVSAASDPAEAVWYVDTLNEMAGERVFGFCLDTGHAMLISQDPSRFALELGDRLCCLHVHDNNGMADQHLLPYAGIIDWERFTQSLARIHYSGEICFETFTLWKRYGPEMGRKALRFLAETGRYFAQKAENA